MSRADAALVMVAAVLAAAATTAMTVAGILTFFTGPATLTIPVATEHHQAAGLALDATGHATALEVTLPALPSGPAAQLAWGAALNQVGVLAVLGIVFLVGYRLRSRILFTPRSGWILGAGGAVLAVAGAVGQVVDGIGRSRLADILGVNGGVPGESTVFSMDFNMAPLMVGMAMLLLGGVFQFGGRLQKDTEGLV